MRLARSHSRVTVLLLGAITTGCRSSPTPASRDDVVRVTTPVQVYSNAGVFRTQVNNESGARSTAMSVPVEQVWAALPEAYAALKLVVTTRLDAERTLGAQNVRVRYELGGQRLSRYVSCGTGLVSGDAADSYEVTLDVVSVVAAASEGGTSLQSSLRAVARPLQTSGDPVQCATTGRLEQRIALLVADRVQR